MLAILAALLLSQATPPSPATPRPEAPAQKAPAQKAPDDHTPARSPGVDHRACLDGCVTRNGGCRIACENAHGTDPLTRTGCDEKCSNRGHACESECGTEAGRAQRQNE